MTADKVVVLGLDGGTLDVVEPWVDAGVLPTFKTLMQRGASGRLRSTTPAITPQAWPSIYTGTNAGKHGIFGFEKRLPGSGGWAKSNASDLARPPIWDLAARRGARSGLFFLPYSYPAAEVNGCLVAGRGAPGGLRDRLSWPRELAADLAARFGEEELFGARRPVGWTLRQIADALVRSVDRQTEAIVSCLEKESFDLTFAVWDQTDTAAHLLWHFSESPCPGPDSPMAAVYRAVDEGMARVIEAAGGDPLVIVCSDHGAYPIRWRVRAPLWLAGQGMLSMRRTLKARALAAAGGAWSTAPAGLRRRMPLSARKVAHSAHNKVITQNTLIDWRRTRVYPEPITAEAFRINVRGREPFGSVDMAEAPGVLSALSDALSSLETPDGTKVVESVVTNAHAYNGPLSDLGPDLIAEPAYGMYFSPTGTRPLFSSPSKPSLDDQPASLGYHHPDGLLTMAGPNVAPANVSATVYDIAPTILRVLGVPIPRDLDGSALDGAFSSLPDASWSDEDMSVRPRTEGAVLSPDEEEEIERRLYDLGYLD